jgi:hypothetical protein
MKIHHIVTLAALRRLPACLFAMEAKALSCALFGLLLSMPAVGIRLGWSPEVVARDQPCRMALAGHHRWGNGSSSKALFSSIHSSVYFRLHCWNVHLLTDCTTILGGIVGIISIAT